MIFVYPWVLWGIFLPLGMWVFFTLRYKVGTKSFFSKEVLQKLSSDHTGMQTKTRTALLSLASMLMIVALAQPVIEKERVKISERAVDLVVALDISVSMEAKDLYPNRLEWAKKKLLSLIDRSEGLRVGVMAFAAHAYVVTPLTTDQEVARYLVHNLQTESITEKGTDILQLVDAAARQMQEQNHKTMLLITDGGDESDYKAVINLAKEKKITLFVLGIGTKAGAPIATKEGGFIKQNGKIVLTQLNPAIKEVALQTGGSYIETVSSHEDITTMLSEIKSSVSAQEIAEDEVRRVVELFGYVLALAALLLLIALGSLPRAIAVIGLLVMPLDMKAGMLDFLTLKEAQKAYEAGDFNKSIDAFSVLNEHTPTSQTAYNLGNAFYKAGQYEKALQAYAFVDANETHYTQTLHNIGNSFAKTGKLNEAKEAYEKALALKDDVQTNENLQEVLKHLKKEEEQKQEQQDQEEQNKDKQKQKEEQEKKEQQKQDSQEQNKEEPSSEDASQENQKEQDKPQEQQEQQQQQQPKEAKKEEQPNETQEVAPKPQPSQEEITDKQEEKVLEMLNQQQGTTYRYQIESEHKKEQYDKPW